MLQILLAPELKRSAKNTKEALWICWVWEPPKETASIISDCYTRSEVPDQIIEKSIGLVQYTKKGIAGDVPSEIDGIFQSL